MKPARSVHTAEWIDHFRRRGFAEAAPLAAGVEGAVYSLGQGRVAKVWQQRSHDDLLRMQRFYQDVLAHTLSFATPEIYSVEEVDATLVTIERHLPGKPMIDRLDVNAAEVDPVAADGFVNILRELATVAPTQAMKELHVLDEPQPFWQGSDSFCDALSALIERRVNQFGDLLQLHVSHLDRKLEGILALLAATTTAQESVIHGDLFPDNVLVDEAGVVSAVLDFGFLSTAGDAQFDAAVSGAIFNMYGKHAVAITDQLTAQLALELNCPPETQWLYRAAYALTTSNTFSTQANDDHFNWCTAILNRNEVAQLAGA